MLYTGTYGAKVQSWKKANPRELLKRLIDGHPSAEKSFLLVKLREELFHEENIEYLEAMIEYWFINNYHSLVFRPNRQERDRSHKAKQRRVSAVKERIESRILEEAQLMLLDMILPTGRSLRESSGEDCERAGGWLSQVAKKIQPGQIVGDVMTEEQVRRLWKAAKQ